ncbi:MULTISPECIES: LapA family protein [Bacillus]|uniref:Lipopolysaccharide assembly protein A domain-containing protein n=2 Tax=Bacillus TaxID=1386 RepID=A0A0M4FR22_9BACI|nr:MULTISPECIES: lipopolysaccharide assembly protein LapA domain-containing protein [Bacillus]ALC81823.1 hypothetical protein AM592_09560 [Bacillus gobiensis]MBP1080932.1 putative integral membrane protein [Bacillus capparidis]MED1097568.1 lipopolysaccharide assembly protein LapA domain-containing protein [Bacillus capparidis]
MNRQWAIILALIFTLLVAIFAVINVEPVQVDYLFGTSEWPLILVILVSVLMGAVIMAAVGIIQIAKLKKEIKVLSAKLKQTQTSSVLTEDEENKKSERSNRITHPSR